MIRVAHVVTGLGVGGGEMMLAKLVEGLPPDEFSSFVVSLTGPGPLAGRIETAGAEVVAEAGPSTVRVPSHLRRWRPDVVQTWMYKADVYGSLAARLAVPRAPLVWNVQNSDLDPAGSTPSTLRAARVCARLSGRLPARIVCCAHAAREVHERLGYDGTNMVVIPNGVDTAVFRPDPAARAAVRAELAIPGDAIVIGLVARVDPQKDHQTFVEAARHVAGRVPAATFVLVGKGTDTDPPLGAAAAELGPRLRLLGLRDDLPRLTAAFDVALSTSAFGEGLANTLAEAMACEVPCVVTDVGESARLVGATGRVVTRRDPRALGAAIVEIATLPEDERRRLGARARARIQEHFELADTVERYADLYAELSRPRVA